MSDTDQTKKKVGNPNFKKHRPNKKRRDLVKSLVKYGVRHEYICDHLGITKPTLYKYYQKDIADARIFAHVQMGKSIYQRAISGDTSAAIFYAKTQMGWKETQVNEITGEDGDPIEISSSPAEKLLNFLNTINNKIGDT